VGPSPQGHPLAEQSLLRQVQLYNLDYFRIWSCDFIIYISRLRKSFFQP
jgi:hypothetical protein